MEPQHSRRQSIVFRGKVRVTIKLDRVQKLEHQIKALERNIKELKREKNQILQQRSKKKDTISELIAKNIVIAFVEAIERADQYFNFKEYLKQEKDIQPGSDPKSIFNTICERPVWRRQFGKVEDKDLLHAINLRILQVKKLQIVTSTYEFKKYITRCEFITQKSSFLDDMKAVDNQDHFPGLSFSEMEALLERYKGMLYPSLSKEELDASYIESTEKEYRSDMALWKEGKDHYVSIHVITNLVFLTHRAQYLMDHDPEKELEKIVLSCPFQHYALLSELKKMMKSDHKIDVEPSVEEVEKMLSSMRAKALKTYSELLSRLQPQTSQ